MTDERPILTTGIHAGIAAAVYHADPCPEPSLSSSIAAMLCNQSPAHACHAHPRLNPAAVAEEAEHFDLGTAAHALLLEGTHADVVIIDAGDWRTKAARESRDAARQAGRVPLLARHWSAVQAMVTAAREQLDEHTDGGALMFLAGEPEQTVVWSEEGTWCRARFDYLRPSHARSIGWAIDDYKSTGISANPDAWTRAMFYNGTDIQAAWYLRGLRIVSGVEAVFRFAVQETYPPYALSVISLGPDALVLAEKKCLWALEQWRAGLASADWPGYPRRTAYATLPAAHETWWLEKELG